VHLRLAVETNVSRLRAGQAVNVNRPLCQLAARRLEAVA
jgi:hypothetical protein